MAGWNLKASEGNQWEEILSNEEIIDKLQSFFSKKTTMKNLYKLTLLESLTIVSSTSKNCFKNIFFEVLKVFGEIYWELERTIKIKKTIYNGYSEISDQEKLIREIKETHFLKENIKYEELNELIKNDYIEKTTIILKKNVLGALYNDFEGYIYFFDKKEEKLILNPSFLIYFKNNKNFIKRIISLRTVEFLKISKEYKNNLGELNFIVQDIEVNKNYYEDIFMLLENER
ncbi:hypothetical protein [Cetobacterium sp. SF1]|uniref:hypothetical protein n=1 Tax=Cetobacterium sp. SF1 TaxID=3417654 RepID=UPI003CF60865